jgi:hypothetical protein
MASEVPLKYCSGCKTAKVLTEFGRDASQPDGLQRQCRACRSRVCARYRSANPEKVAASNSRWAKANPENGAAKATRYYLRLRAKIFGHYGEHCACCGSGKRLTIDHVNGDGAEHRTELLGRPQGSGSTETLYRWLIANGFPEGFQTLCRPCNASKFTLGACRLDHAGRT